MPLTVIVVCALLAAWFVLLYLTWESASDLILSGKYRRALYINTLSILMCPLMGRSYVIRGAIFSALRDKPAAELNYRRAIRYYSLALHLRVGQSGNFANRAMAYSQIMQYELALQDYDRALARLPRAQTYASRATIHLKLYHTDDAIADCEVALKRRPNYLDAQNLRGAAYMQKRDYDHALAIFDSIIEKSPRYWGAQVNRGLTHLFRHQYTDAIADFERAELVISKTELPRGMKALALMLDRQYDAALESVNPILEQDPTNEFALKTRAMVHAMQHNTASALHDANAVLDRWADEAAYACRGLVNLCCSRVNDAIDDLNRAIAMYPWLVGAYISRSTAYRMLDQYDAALADLNTAFSWDPQFEEIHTARCAVYFAMGQMEQALESAQTAVTLAPAYRPAKADLAIIKFAMGDTDEAQTLWRELIAHDARYRDIDRVAHVAMWDTEMADVARQIVASL